MGLRWLAKKGGFTSEGSTYMPRNGRLTGCESCHDPPQATRLREVGWVKEAPKWGGLSLWNKVVWNECICPCGEHTLGVIAHEGISLDVEVSEHFVRAPPADEADDVRVHSG